MRYDEHVIMLDDIIIGASGMWEEVKTPGPYDLHFRTWCFDVA